MKKKKEFQSKTTKLSLEIIENENDTTFEFSLLADNNKFHHSSSTTIENKHMDFLEKSTSEIIQTTFVEFILKLKREYERKEQEKYTNPFDKA